MENEVRRIPILYCIDSNLCKKQDINTINNGIKRCCKALKKNRAYRGIEVGFVVFDRKPKAIIPPGESSVFLSVDEYVKNLPKIEQGQGASCLNKAILFSLEVAEQYYKFLNETNFECNKPSLLILTNGETANDDESLKKVIREVSDKLIFDKWHIAIIAIKMSDDKKIDYEKVVTNDFNSGDFLEIRDMKNFAKNLSFASQSIPILINDIKFE